ncbi:AMP-dependent synthetase/ligase [Trinorchestia longiramus]|nr:AMP-dependent synthetase/ligase [Trinorchestia longiramus]
MLSRVAREVCRSHGLSARATQRLQNKLSVRKLCIPASASRTNDEVVFRSPFTDVDIPNVSLIQFLREKTEGYENRVSLVCGETGEELRYGEVWRRIDSVASAFLKLGVGRNATVAMVIPNCPEFTVTFLAAISAGCTVTTVNCLATASEMARQLENSEASVVVYHPLLAGVVQQAVHLLQECSVSLKALVCTEGAAPEGHVSLSDLYGESAASLDHAVVNPSEDLAVLPYSSGTTGLPKGVMLTHSNIVANLTQVLHPDITEVNPDGDLMFGVLPMFHIYGMVTCMLLSFATGCTTVTFHKFDPQLYVSSLIKYQASTLALRVLPYQVPGKYPSCTCPPLSSTRQPTVLHTVPPILGFLAQTPEVKPEFLRSVRMLVCGAAPVGEALAHSITAKFDHGLSFQEGYGMTEMSPVSHMTSKTGYVPGSCGVPVPNTLSKIVHPDTGVVLAAGEGEGELLVKGPQVMKGYLKNAEATAETLDAEGWLHTGDIARVDSIGNCYIVDRLKELIKVKGFQVAPAELEDLIRGSGGVADVAVVGVPDDKTGERPRAYVVKTSKDSVTAEELIEYVSSRVSVHKQLTGGVVFIDAIPKNMTGKILRKELRDLAAKECSP